MAKNYTTPDFDVTSYDVADVIALDFGGMEGDDLFNPSNTGTEED